MNKRGFTTIELLVAIAILSISMIFISAFVVNLKDEKGNISIDVKYLITHASIVQKLNYDAHIYGIDDINVFNNSAIITLLTGDKRKIEIVNNKTIKYTEDNKILFVKTLNGNKEFNSLVKSTPVESYDDSYQYIKLTIEVTNGENIELHSYSDSAPRIVVAFDVNGGIPITEEECFLSHYDYSLGVCKKVVGSGKTIGDLLIPNRMGYDFIGWFTEENVEINSESILNEGPITLYAHWSAKNYICNAGEYLKAGETTCRICPKGSYCLGIPSGTFYNETLDQGISKCAVGSYSMDGASECTACGLGTTNTLGSSECNSTCSNNNFVYSWETPVWNLDNTVTNHCKIKRCETGYYPKNNVCVESHVYTVTFDCNGGSGNAPSADTHALNPYNQDNKSCGYIVDETAKKIYYQTGWSTSNEPGSTAMTDIIVDESITSVTLYATWAELFTYSNGNYLVLNDNDGNWRVKFLSSGTLTMNNETEVDVFVVGGGGAGGGGGTNSSNTSEIGGGGGGGGYTNTCSSVLVSAGNKTVYVGAGGVGCAWNSNTCPQPTGTNGETSYFINNTVCAATGGTGGGYVGSSNKKGGAGGSGGSGGGGGGHNGGSYTKVSGAGGSDGSSGSGDASNSEKTVGVAGEGSGTTTREFGLTTGDLYSGGGSGGGGYRSYNGTYTCATSIGTPGSGGGGAGGLCKTSGENGTPNTGGGGGGGAARFGGYYAGGNGGSGIVIIRNHR